MNFKPRILLCLFALISTVAVGQKLKPDAIVHYKREQVDSAANSKVTPDKPGRLLALGNDNERYLIVVRTGEGAAEMHELYDDVAIIKSGSGILRSGFKLTGSKITGDSPAREWLGGKLEDVRERKVKEGDFLVIPAMLGHQYIPNQGDSLVYFTIKVKHAKK